MRPKVNELYIELVGGGGLGEAIILRLPDGRFGLIDCYSPISLPVEKNLVITRLNALGATGLQFVALTHPHQDHFLGMSQVLEKLSPKEFWLFAGATQAMMERLPAYLTAEALHAKGKNDSYAVTDLKKTLVWVNNNVGSGRVDLKYLTGFQQLLSYPVNVEGAEVEVVVQSIAPMASVVRRYEQKLLTNYNSKAISTGEELDHNDLSAAFLISYGQTRVLLGGDVTTDTWNAILASENNRLDLSNMAFVKISHHGSTNGYCDGLWEVLSQGRKPKGGLTPYTSQLPKRKALEHVALYASEIAATRISAENKAVRDLIKFPPGTPIDVSNATRRIAKSATPMPRGSLSYTFDAAGNVSGPELQGSACFIHQAAHGD